MRAIIRSLPKAHVPAFASVTQAAAVRANQTAQPMDMTNLFCRASAGDMEVSIDCMVDSLTLPTFSCNLVDIDDGHEW
jgi:hypothetical protein